MADALERTHSQRVTNLTVEITDSKAHLVLEGILDATAERLALPSKADLFENLFGLSLHIKES